VQLFGVVHGRQSCWGTPCPLRMWARVATSMPLPPGADRRKSPMCEGRCKLPSGKKAPQHQFNVWTFGDYANRQNTDPWQASLLAPEVF
jgi:hypothetical protein